MSTLAMCTSCRSTIDPDADAVVFDDVADPQFIDGEVEAPRRSRWFHAEHAPSGWENQPRARHGRMRDLSPR